MIRSIGIIAGFKAELRRVPRALQHLAGCSGGSAERAAGLAKAFAERGAECLVSFGLAGGLDPQLRPGAVILASEVDVPDLGSLTVAETWHADVLGALQSRGIEAYTGRITGRDDPALTPVEKQDLACATGAVAVDMESHAVARVAVTQGRAFLVLRAVGDPADRAVPALALAGLGPDGATRPLGVLNGLLRQPAQLPALIALARDSARGLKALRSAAPALMIENAVPPGRG